MTSNIEHSCPNCEYERSSRGRPVVQGDEITCLECGNSWKEFNGSGESKAEKTKSATIAELRKMAQNSTHSLSELEDEPTKPIKDASFLNAQSQTTSLRTPFALVALLFVAFIGGTYWFNGLSNEVASQTGPIIISEVKLKEQLSRNGRKVITVRGLLQNSTTKTEHIPSVAIVLRKKDGGEIIRWRYNPPNALLKPGVKTRFASSIQYDTPVVAYAEATIE